MSRLRVSIETVLNIETNRDFRAGVANAGPAGHFWPARAFEMARGDFWTGSNRNFIHKLAIKELKLGPPRIL